MGSAPTLVLVHGAWHGPWAWRRLVEELTDLDVRTVALPSVGPDPRALGDMHTDAEAVRAAIAVVDGPVVVCAHAYGGMPVTQAAAGIGNVVGLVYVCGFQLDVGESILSAVGGRVPSWWDVHRSEGYVDPLRPFETFYADVRAHPARGAVARLAHQSLVAFEQPLTRAAWRTIPSTYVVCERDAAIPVVAQELMAERADRVLRMPTSHAPFLSRPAQLAGVLRAELLAARRPAVSR
ncbi:MAG TPA: alpha/beta hydrolase [Pseudonocardia sp.]|jgi:pimeloyl-ACP methyl ester carboxylesterase|uniref:alpha/beta fold hydrolase n=1 Tax=Pseudonocardia sp. TaxID=60912 RepID=UPI002B4B1A7E|nr:alpha/beta hydrolase [Pseudonocardia sp.]HLU58317.1 alpha/beta hydrolase [Pseudonocardia sp.]